jgi:hypothetical protein
MKNTRKVKRGKSKKFSKKNKRGGISFPSGYNPLKGFQNRFGIRNRTQAQGPMIGEHKQTMAIEFMQNVQPLKDIEQKMDDIMKNLAEQKMNCINECRQKGCNDSQTCVQVKEMIEKKPIYEWGFMCANPLNVKTCADFMKNIRDMDLYIGAIKELNAKIEKYDAVLNEIKKSMNVSDISMNDDFSTKEADINEQDVDNNVMPQNE